MHTPYNLIYSPSKPPDADETCQSSMHRALMNISKKIILAQMCFSQDRGLSIEHRTPFPQVSCKASLKSHIG